MSAGDVVAMGTADDTLSELASGALWHDWLNGPGSGEGLDTWLQRLAAALPDHVTECREEELRLAALWQHMLPKLAQFLPGEITHMVQAQLDASARRGAAEALAGMVRAERTRLAGGAPSGVIDDHTLLRLLDGIASDRVTTGRALTAEVLETLCSIALDLELTERRVGDSNDYITEMLTDLRSHVTGAAEMLRRLPGNVAVLPEASEAVSAAVGRSLTRYAETLETRLEWRGGEPPHAEAAAALVWVVQELLHHLHGCTAGSTAMFVTAGTPLRVTVHTPSDALAPKSPEPDWLLRSRLRLQLAGGTITASAVADGSQVEFQIP
jgi:hypothetical protein